MDVVHALVQRGPATYACYLCGARLPLDRPFEEHRRACPQEQWLDCPEDVAAHYPELRDNVVVFPGGGE